jgi:gliding motility-associated-like protein
MVKTVISVIVSFLLLFGLHLHAQISAPDKNGGIPAAYSSNPGTDSVFIFNRPLFQSGRTVSIIATSADKTPGWNFIWSVFNPVSCSWEIIPKADTGSISIIDTITSNTGYQVIMSKGPQNDTFTVWVVFNDFSVFITNKDDSAKIRFGDYNCTSVSFFSDTMVTQLIYYDPYTCAVNTVKNSYTIRWTASDDESDIPPNRLITRLDSPPYKDTWYKINITDNFKLVRSDSVLCPAIASKAYFQASYVTLSDSVEYPDKLYKYYYDDEKSAPGKFRFDLSGSENAVWYQLKFGDGEIYEPETDSEKIVHEYKFPGEYTAVLVTKSPAPLGCIDSFRLENSIELEDTLFMLPNVFTPNADGHNDVIVLYEENSNNVFRSYDISVTTIEITIFNRAGRKVHEYTGNIRDWKGWDGNIMRSNLPAPEGVYFYCLTYYYFVTKEGENPRQSAIFNRKDLKGFIHLYRED